MSASTTDRFKRLGDLPYDELSPGPLRRLVVEKLASGKLVAWVQGRAAIGGEPLGNRNVFADPRIKSLQRDARQRLRLGEGLMSFGCAVLAEDGRDYFEDYEASPYMERSLRLRDAALRTLPGVALADGTARVQTVSRELNEPLHELILQFKRLTGIPVLFTTSLRLEGKPPVHSVEDTVAAFLTMGIEVLVLDGVVVTKPALHRTMAHEGAGQRLVGPSRLHDLEI